MRRITAIVLTVLLGQLFLAGEAAACLHADAGAEAAHEMPAESEGGTHQKHAAQQDAGTSAAPSGGVIAPSGDGCLATLPPAPPCDHGDNGRACLAAGGCTSAAAFVTVPAIVSPVGGSSSGLPAHAETQRSLSIAPELPPPRA